MSDLTRILLRHNLALLDQGARPSSGRIDDRLYARPAPLLGRASVGSHVRHCLDHLGCLVAGLGRGRVYYEARARDRRLETDRRLAAARLAAALRAAGVEPGEEFSVAPSTLRYRREALACPA